MRAAMRGATQPRGEPAHAAAQDGWDDPRAPPRLRQTMFQCVKLHPPLVDRGPQAVEFLLNRGQLTLRLMKFTHIRFGEAPALGLDLPDLGLVGVEPGDFGPDIFGDLGEFCFPHAALGGRPGLRGARFLLSCWSRKIRAASSGSIHAMCPMRTTAPSRP
jgi:hypothetical protein